MLCLCCSSLPAIPGRPNKCGIAGMGRLSECNIRHYHERGVYNTGYGYEETYQNVGRRAIFIAHEQILSSNVAGHADSRLGGIRSLIHHGPKSELTSMVWEVGGQLLAMLKGDAGCPRAASINASLGSSQFFNQVRAGTLAEALDSGKASFLFFLSFSPLPRPMRPGAGGNNTE